MIRRFLSAAFFSALFLCPTGQAVEWVKHTITEQGRNHTAVASDFTGDKVVDVITSAGGRVSLFTAPDWEETVLYRFASPKRFAIHSEVIDVDGDGDEDWIGSHSTGKPFWLENPGVAGEKWEARVFDEDIRGIHCILKADVDNDGREEIIMNNFQPEGPLADSIVFFRIPENPRAADVWERIAFADGDARGGSHYFGFGDLDGDGWGEIAVGAKGAPFEDGNWFAFWTNPGAEGVDGPWEKTLLADEQLAATCILPGDLDGDGDVDLLASRGHSAGVLWFEAPDWTIHEIDETILSPHSLTLADYDGDGDLDGASCGYESARLVWYENDGKGDFTAHTIDDDQESYDLRTVDMDGDGDPDLLNAGRGSGNVVWYENR